MATLKHTSSSNENFKQVVDTLRTALRERGPLPVKKLIGYIGNLPVGARDIAGHNECELERFIAGASNVFRISQPNNVVHEKRIYATEAKICKRFGKSAYFASLLKSPGELVHIATEITEAYISEVGDLNIGEVVLVDAEGREPKELHSNPENHPFAQWCATKLSNPASNASVLESGSEMSCSTSTITSSADHDPVLFKEVVDILRDALKSRGPMPVKNLIGYIHNKRLEVRQVAGHNESELERFLKGIPNVFEITETDRNVQEKTLKRERARITRVMGKSTYFAVLIKDGTEHVYIPADVDKASCNEHSILKVNDIVKVDAYGKDPRELPKTNDVAQWAASSMCSIPIHENLEKNTVKILQSLRDIFRDKGPMPMSFLLEHIHQSKSQLKQILQTVDDHDFEAFICNKHTVFEISHPNNTVYLKKIQSAKAKVTYVCSQYAIASLCEDIGQLVLIKSRFWMNLQPNVKLEEGQIISVNGFGIDPIEYENIEMECKPEWNVASIQILSKPQSDMDSEKKKTNGRNDPVLFKEVVDILRDALRSHGPLPVKNLIGYIHKCLEVRELAGHTEGELEDFLRQIPYVFEIAELGGNVSERKLNGERARIEKTVGQNIYFASLLTHSDQHVYITSDVIDSSHQGILKTGDVIDIDAFGRDPRELHTNPENHQFAQWYATNASSLNVSSYLEENISGILHSIRACITNEGPRALQDLLERKLRFQSVLNQVLNTICRKDVEDFILNNCSSVFVILQPNNTVDLKKIENARANVSSIDPDYYLASLSDHPEDLVHCSHFIASKAMPDQELKQGQTIYVDGYGLHPLEHNRSHLGCVWRATGLRLSPFRSDVCENKSEGKDKVTNGCERRDDSATLYPAENQSCDVYSNSNIRKVNKELDTHALKQAIENLRGYLEEWGPKPVEEIHKHFQQKSTDRNLQQIIGSTEVDLKAFICDVPFAFELEEPHNVVHLKKIHESEGKVTCSLKGLGCFVSLCNKSGEDVYIPGQVIKQYQISWESLKEGTPVVVDAFGKDPREINSRTARTPKWRGTSIIVLEHNDAANTPECRKTSASEVGMESEKESKEIGSFLNARSPSHVAISHGIVMNKKQFKNVMDAVRTILREEGLIDVHKLYDILSIRMPNILDSAGIVNGNFQHFIEGVPCAFDFSSQNGTLQLRTIENSKAIVKDHYPHCIVAELHTGENVFIHKYTARKYNTLLPSIHHNQVIYVDALGKDPRELGEIKHVIRWRATDVRLKKDERGACCQKEKEDTQILSSLSFSGDVLDSTELRHNGPTIESSKHGEVSEATESIHVQYKEPTVEKDQGDNPLDISLSTTSTNFENHHRCNLSPKDCCVEGKACKIISFTRKFLTENGPQNISCIVDHLWNSEVGESCKECVIQVINTAKSVFEFNNSENAVYLRTIENCEAKITFVSLPGPSLFAKLTQPTACGDLVYVPTNITIDTLKKHKKKFQIGDMIYVTGYGRDCREVSPSARYKAQWRATKMSLSMGEEQGEEIEESENMMKSHVKCKGQTVYDPNNVKPFLDRMRDALKANGPQTVQHLYGRIHGLNQREVRGIFLQFPDVFTVDKLTDVVTLNTRSGMLAVVQQVFERHSFATLSEDYDNVYIPLESLGAILFQDMRKVLEKGHHVFVDIEGQTKHDYIKGSSQTPRWKSWNTRIMSVPDQEVRAAENCNSDILCKSMKSLAVSDDNAVKIDDDNVEEMMKRLKVACEIPEEVQKKITPDLLSSGETIETAPGNLKQAQSVPPLSHEGTGNESQMNANTNIEVSALEVSETGSDTLSSKVPGQVVEENPNDLVEIREKVVTGKDASPNTLNSHSESKSGLDKTGENTTAMPTTNKATLKPAAPWKSCKNPEKFKGLVDTVRQLLQGLGSVHITFLHEQLKQNVNFTAEIGDQVEDLEDFVRNIPAVVCLKEVDKTVCVQHLTDAEATVYNPLLNCMFATLSDKSKGDVYISNHCMKKCNLQIPFKLMKGKKVLVDAIGQDWREYLSITDKAPQWRATKVTLCEAALVFETKPEFKEISKSQEELLTKNGSLVKSTRDQKTNNEKVAAPRETVVEVKDCSNVRKSSLSHSDRSSVASSTEAFFLDEKISVSSECSDSDFRAIICKLRDTLYINGPLRIDDLFHMVQMDQSMWKDSMWETETNLEEFILNLSDVFTLSQPGKVVQVKELNNETVIVTFKAADHKYLFAATSRESKDYVYVPCSAAQDAAWWTLISLGHEITVDAYAQHHREYNGNKGRWRATKVGPKHGSIPYPQTNTKLSPKGTLDCLREALKKQGGPFPIQHLFGCILGMTEAQLKDIVLRYPQVFTVKSPDDMVELKEMVDCRATVQCVFKTYCYATLSGCLEEVFIPLELLSNISSNPMLDLRHFFHIGQVVMVTAVGQAECDYDNHCDIKPPWRASKVCLTTDCGDKVESVSASFGCGDRMSEGCQTDISGLSLGSMCTK